MNWESWANFWAMGGAGFYVWGSYGVTVLMVALELFQVVRRRKLTLFRLQRLRRAAMPRDLRPTFESPENS
ncbi:MAG: heme exporter protein CcmD [Rhodocyclaceae bacterium]|jgi:heme exporter protein D|nr:heme exporter protein CcmD [Rhodocyclaceae bacterium]